MGDIVGDINRRRGQVNDMGDKSSKTIKADVPLSEMLCNNVNAFSGETSFTMEFHTTRKLLLIFQ
jgi:elongation factor G